jgi:urease accessory protein UreH
MNLEEFVEKLANDEDFKEEIQDLIYDYELENFDEVSEHFEEEHTFSVDEWKTVFEKFDFEFGDPEVEVPVLMKNFVSTVNFYSGAITIKKSDLEAIRNGEKEVQDFLTGDEDWDLIRDKITSDDYDYELD